MKKLSITVIAVLLMSAKTKAQEFIPLWPKGKMPNSKGMKLTDSISNERIHRVGTPGMYAFFPSMQENRGAAVLICPGGGYERLAYIISGTQLAKWFNTIGISAFVLNYRLPNSPDLKEREKGPLQDAQRALKLIAANAGKWKIDTTRIGIQGSSAGGHLASLAGTASMDLSIIKDSLDNYPYRPHFMILVSPVIDMGNLAHKGSRRNLPENSLLFYQALLRNNIPSALHIFPQGGHAIALRNNPGSAEQWTLLCEEWLKENAIVSGKK